MIQRRSSSSPISFFLFPPSLSFLSARRHTLDILDNEDCVGGDR